MPKLLCLLLPLYLFVQVARAQGRPPTDSARVVVLTDVAVSDKIARLVVATGKPKHNVYHLLAPGNTIAVRFWAPRADYHQLSQLLVHLISPGSIQEGSLRVRVASVMPEGQPADDDLLATPVLLTTATLQHARQHLTLTWPAGHRVTVPATGVFLVFECLGQQPDEYVSSLVPSPEPKRMGKYEISRRDHPEVSPRLTTPDIFPTLAGATPATTNVEN